MLWVGSLENKRQTFKSINSIKLKKISISLNSLHGKFKIRFQYHSHFTQGKSNVTQNITHFISIII